MSAIIRHIAREDYRDKFIDGKHRGRLFYALMFLIVVMVVSCGKSSQEAKSNRPEGNKELSAIVLLPDGSLKLDIVLMVTNVDTFKNDDGEYYKVDTIFGVPEFFNKVDSAGRASIDSATGKPIRVRGWRGIGSDSVSVINYTPITFFTQKFNHNPNGKK